MMLRVLVVLSGALALLPWLSHAAAPPVPRELRALAGRTPVDSLVRVLRQRENDPTRSRDAGETALLLGRLHYARGEYRAAADAFGRAAARLGPDAKNEARYWAGLAWLAMRSPNVARASLEEVTAVDGPRRVEAVYAVALAWEMANRPDRALETLEPLVAAELGEIGASVLETYATLADRQDRPDAASRARARLVAEYPRSMDAAAAIRAPDAVTDGDAGPGSVAVEIGRFATAARARVLLQRAERASFRDARVVERGEGPSRTWAVQLGRYPNEAEAREAGTLAQRRLGVEYRLERGR